MTETDENLTVALNERTRRSRLKRAGRTFIGALVLLVGLVAIPYPGPGWLIVFAALAILARDYPWAERLLGFARGKYEEWLKWAKKQSYVVRGVLFMCTTIVVIGTIYLLNGYGLINAWFHLGLDWLNSPLPIFN